MPTKKNIESPDKLLEYFERYNKHCKLNPRIEHLYNPKLDKQVKIEREAPLTWQGFEVWLFRNKKIVSLKDYRGNTGGNYSEYSEVIRTIDTIMYEDKITGATTGIYQHNIIARLLGLTDKQDHNHSGEVNISPKKWTK